MHKLTQTQKKENERKNPPEEDPEFQIAPMIDILLVLLVFFMSIASTEVLQSNQEIALPIAKDGKAASKNNPGQVIINVTWVALNNIGAIEVNDKNTRSRPRSFPPCKGRSPPILSHACWCAPTKPCATNTCARCCRPSARPAWRTSHFPWWTRNRR